MLHIREFGSRRCWRQRDRLNEPTISTACSRKILSSTSIIVLSQVDPTVPDLRQELSATQSQVNRLNWELTSSTDHATDLENQLNHTQDMHHDLLQQESQQLRQDPRIPPRGQAHAEPKKPSANTAGSNPSLIVGSNLPPAQSSATRNTTARKQNATSGNFSGIPHNRETYRLTG